MSAPRRPTGRELADRLDEIGAHQFADAVRDEVEWYESRWWRRLRRWVRKGPSL